VSDDQDIDVKIDVKKGTARATISAWAAGVAAIIGAVGVASAIWGKFIFAVLALALQYEEVNFGDASASKYGRPRFERQQHKDQERQIAYPEKKLEDNLREYPRTKIGEKTGDKKIGQPIDLTPKIVDGGTIQRIEPYQQGDPEEDNPETAPKGTFEEGGRLYEKRPYECKTLGGVPMSYEACSVSPKSPSGRPVVRQ
jgi:hypothetical protein